MIFKINKKLGRIVLYFIKTLSHVLNILAISSFLLINSPCSSMDSESDHDEGETRVTVHKSDVSASTAPPLKKSELDAIAKLPFIIPDPKSPLRDSLNKLVEDVMKANPELSQDNEIEKTSLILFYKHKYTTAKDRDHPDIFFENLDKKIFIRPTSKLTRVIQIGTTVVFVPAALAYALLGLYLSGPVLGTSRQPGVLPVDSSYSNWLLGAIVVFTLPVVSYDGWQGGRTISDILCDFLYKSGEGARKVGKFLFYKSGFTDTNEDSKPHIQPEDNPIKSRLFSYLDAFGRTLPFGYIFWKSQEPFPPSFVKGLIAPLCLSRFTQIYSNNMDYMNHRKLTDSQKILIGSLDNTRDWINGEESDALVKTLYKSRAAGLLKLQQRLKERKELSQEIKSHLFSRKIEKISPLISEYIKRELREVPYRLEDTTLKKAIDDLIVKHKRNILNVGLDKFDTKTVKPLIREIRDYIENNLQIMKLAHAIEHKNNLIHKLSLGLNDYLKGYFSHDGKHDFFKNIYLYIQSNLSVSIQSDVGVLLRSNARNRKGATTFDYEPSDFDEGKNEKTAWDIDLLILEELIAPLDVVVQEYMRLKFSQNENKKNVLFLDFLKQKFKKIQKTKIHKPAIFSEIRKQVARYIQPPTSEKFEDISFDSKVVMKEKTKPLKENVLLDNEYLQVTDRIISEALNKIDISSLALKIYKYLQRESGKTMLKDDLGVATEDTHYSLLSAYFLKYPPLVEYSDFKKDLVDGAEKISKIRQAMDAEIESDKESDQDIVPPKALRFRGKKATKTQNSSQDSSHELPKLEKKGEYVQVSIDGEEDLTEVTKQVGEVAKKVDEAARQAEELAIEKMAMRLYALDKKPQKGRLQRFLEAVAPYFQGRAALAQDMLTFWIDSLLLMECGASPQYAFAGGAGLSIIQTYARAMLESYVQKDTFSSLRNFGSRANDFWPLRWGGAACAFVSSAFYSLNIIAAPFVVLNTNATLNTNTTYNGTCIVKEPCIFDDPNILDDPDILKQTAAYFPVLNAVTLLGIKSYIALNGLPTELASYFHRHMKPWNAFIRRAASLSLGCGATVPQMRSVLNDDFDRIKELIPQFDEATIKQILYYTQDIHGVRETLEQSSAQ